MCKCRESWERVLTYRHTNRPIAEVRCCLHRLCLVRVVAGFVSFHHVAVIRDMTRTQARRVTELFFALEVEFGACVPDTRQWSWGKRLANLSPASPVKQVFLSEMTLVDAVFRVAGVLWVRTRVETTVISILTRRRAVVRCRR